MDMGILKTLNKEELESYLEFLLWHYRLVDAFWFLSVADRFDQGEPVVARGHRREDLPHRRVGVHRQHDADRGVPVEQLVESGGHLGQAGAP